MRSVKDIQGSRPAGLTWDSAKNLTAWGPFIVIGARPLPTKFGDKVEFWLEHVETHERKGILLTPTSVRQTYVDWFTTPDADMVGPCTLVWSGKYWSFLDTKEAEEVPPAETATT